MTTSDDRSVVGDVEFATTSGTGSGWIGLVLIALGLWFAVTGGGGVVAVRLVLGLLLAAVLVYAYLMRPRVRIRRDALELVNPLSTVIVPLSLVSAVSVRSVTKVRVGEKRYAGVGVGRRVREMARGQAEGAAPGAESWSGRLTSALRFSTPVESTRPKPQETADLLEDTVARAVLQVRDATPAGQEPPVRRTWTWWVVGPALVLLVALVVSLLV